MEEKLRSSNGNPKLASEGRSISTAPSRRQSLGGTEHLSRLSSNGYLSRRNTNSHTGSLQSNSASALLKTTKISSRSFDGGSRSLDREKLVQDAVVKDNSATTTSGEIQFSETTAPYENEDGISVGKTKTEQEDLVSGVLYDMLQKEVISLRKSCHEKDITLKDKDDAIEVSL